MTITLEHVLDRLSDPSQDEIYLQEVAKLQLLKGELESVERKSLSSQKRRDSMQLESIDDVEKVSKLVAQIDLLRRQADNQSTLIVNQQHVVADALLAAKQVTANEARVLWRDEILPEVIDTIERLMELQRTYSKLRQRTGSGLKPDFPVFRPPHLWLQRRLSEREMESA